MAGHAVIIGVGPGLGAELARRSALGGYAVTLVARRPDTVEAVAAELRDADHDAEALVVDAAYEPALTAALEGIVERRGAPALVVYNAVDPTPTGAPSTLDPEALTMALETSVTGGVVTVNALLEPMRTAGGGSILFTGGILATQPWQRMTSMSIGKAALRNYALCLHQELGDADPVHVATISINGTMKPGNAFDPVDVAERFWQVHQSRDHGDGGEHQFPPAG